MNATAVPSSRRRNYRSDGDRKDRSLFAARIAAIIIMASIAATAFVASRIHAPALGSLFRSPFSASSPRVLWLFVIIIAAGIWILHRAAAPPPSDSSLHYASGWTAQFWHEDGIYPPMMSEYYYNNDVNATGESAFEAEVSTRKSTRVVEPPKEEDDDEGDSMEATWEAIVRRRRERVENAKGAIDLRRRVMNKERGVKVEKKKARDGGWRKREALVVANDELFRRVETFIKKHYDHLKLQRQESEQCRLLEMFHRRSCS